MLLQGFGELLDDPGERLGISVAARLHISLEAAGITEPLDGGRVEHQSEPVRKCHAHAGEFLDCHVGGGGPLIPVD